MATSIASRMNSSCCAQALCIVAGVSSVGQGFFRYVFICFAYMYIFLDPAGCCRRPKMTLAVQGTSVTLFCWLVHAGHMLIQVFVFGVLLYGIGVKSSKLMRHLVFGYIAHKQKYLATSYQIFNTNKHIWQQVTRYCCL